LADFGAVISYEPDGYDTGRDRLMGRQAAGAGFLAGYARYGRTDPISCFSETEALARQFARQVGAAMATQEPKRRRGVRWLPRDRPELLAETGCLYYPSPVIAPLAWQRRAADQRAYSLCGITHTTASDTVMDAFGAFATAPLQSWDAVICTSDAVRRTVDHVLGEWRRYLADRLGGDAARGETAMLQLPVIPLGVDCAAFAEDVPAGRGLRQKLGIADDAVAALFLGRLTASAKAHPMPMYRGLEAAAQRTGRSVHLMLAGWFEHDSEEAAFRAMAQAFAPSITLHILDGRDAELRPAAWSAADLFTSLSDNIQETFGLTPVEAMAAGRPVVISEWNGYRETIKDGVHGFMVPTLAMPPGAGREIVRRYRTGQDSYGGYIGRTAQFTATAPEAAADAYARLIGDDALRRRMGEAGRDHARRQFDWSVIVPRYEELWRDLAARRATDSETAPRRPGAAIDPLRDDPAAVFAHYPTRVLTDDDRVSPCADAPDLAAVTAHRPNIVANRLMLGRRELDTLRQAIATEAESTPARVGDLLALLPAERRDTARRTLVWLQKMGMVRIEAGTGAT
jgi:alpha-maltose-1-phosphate synthase